MHYLIDLSLPDHRLHDIKNALDKTNSNYTFFGLISEENIFTGIDYDIFKINEKFIAISYINAIKLCTGNSFSQKNLFNSDHLTEGEIDNILLKMKNAFFYDDEIKFDQSYYSTLGLPLLNDNAHFIDINGNEGMKFEKDMFIKPSKDLKAFVGGIIKEGQTIEDFVKNGRYQAGWQTEIALIAEVKDIYSEYRFFVLGDEVITGSRYIINGEVVTSTIIPEELLNTAKEYAKLYTPHKLFTMDIAVMKNGDYKIVEYNAFNGSGHYECDLFKLFDKLNKI